MKKKIFVFLFVQFLCLSLFAQPTFKETLEKANAGDANAQCNVGNCYYSGEGAARNYSEAVKWYMKSAKQGNAIAQGMVGLCYYAGQGVTRNYLEALVWLEKAAENGDISAQATLNDKKISKKLYKARAKSN